MTAGIYMRLTSLSTVYTFSHSLSLCRPLIHLPLSLSPSQFYPVLKPVLERGIEEIAVAEVRKVCEDSLNTLVRVAAEVRVRLGVKAYVRVRVIR
jgi:hypothetical protein